MYHSLILTCVSSAYDCQMDIYSFWVQTGLETTQTMSSVHESGINEWMNIYIHASG